MMFTSLYLLFAPNHGIMGLVHKIISHTLAAFMHVELPIVLPSAFWCVVYEVIMQHSKADPLVSTGIDEKKSTFWPES